MPLRSIARASAGANSSVRLDPLGPAAIGLGQLGEIGVGELGRADPLRIVALLVHADGAVGAIVDQDDEQVGAILGGGRQLLPVHQEIAVAGDADHRPVLEAQRGGDRGGQAVAHRAAGRRKLGRHRRHSASSGATSRRNCRRRCR